VKDARDRYANIEVSYLLQRLERYDGVVILATNYERNIDEAFLRRIHVRVEFVIPDVAERAAIWRANLPPAAPQDDLDLDAIALHHELAGGAIRNAALMAAFLAASDGTPITTARVEDALAREYHKLGRLPPRRGR
jgi:SpoVK/Ycf46/Vps4 family AAA+-type ATPase